MIVTINTPSGIVISTCGYDSFITYSGDNDDNILERVEIKGLSHFINFWNRYILVFHSLNPYGLDNDLIRRLEDVKKIWENEIPDIQVLMPYIKKQIIDFDLNLIGIMAGYSKNKDDETEQFVYEILGETIRRINIDPHGRVLYNCFILEKQPMIDRMFREIKIRNGDIWEEARPLRMNCELFSVSKGKEVAKFLVDTVSGFDHINSISLSGYPVEIFEITEKEINISKI